MTNLHKQIEVMVIKEGLRIEPLMISEDEWKLINFIDYIDIDSKGRIEPEFHEYHPNAIDMMERLLKRRKIELMYLEFFNDFLTVERFAEYHGITESSARRIIKLGRLINWGEYQ